MNPPCSYLNIMISKHNNIRLCNLPILLELTFKEQKQMYIFIIASIPAIICEYNQNVKFVIIVLSATEFMVNYEYIEYGLILNVCEDWIGFNAFRSNFPSVIHRLGINWLSRIPKKSLSELIKVN